MFFIAMPFALFRFQRLLSQPKKTVGRVNVYVRLIIKIKNKKYIQNKKQLFLKKEKKRRI